MCDIGLGKDFLDRTQKIQIVKGNIKLDFIKILNVWFLEDTLSKKIATNWEKIFAKHVCKRICNHNIFKKNTTTQYLRKLLKTDQRFA